MVIIFLVTLLPIICSPFPFLGIQEPFSHAFVVGDWVCEFEKGYCLPPSQVYHVLKKFVANLEYKKAIASRKFERSNPHDIQLLSINIKLLRVLMQEACKSSFELPCLDSIPSNMMCYYGFLNQVVWKAFYGI